MICIAQRQMTEFVGHYTTVESGESHDIALPDELQANLWGVTWFPDGERLIIDAYNQSEHHVLWLISTLGGAPRKLRTHSSGAKVSPDGSLIAFLGGHGQEIWVAGADGGNEKRISSGESDDYRSLACSPTGHRLAYVKRLEKAELAENLGAASKRSKRKARA
jgi:Tol biopolymer transport system component